MVYTRQVEGQELTFGVTGKLYKDALVMFDRQTNSLWTQVDGSVLRGPMKGNQLQELPAVQTTWRQWKQMHPETLVLKKEKQIVGTPYADYQRDPAMMGIAGTRNPDPRLPGKALVVTLREDGDALAVPVKALEKTPLYQTQLAGKPLAVVFNPSSGTARVFDRRVDGQRLSFRVVRRAGAVWLKDSETNTLWSGLTGRAVEGELTGKELGVEAHMVSYWFAWVAYNPRTRLEKP